MVSQVAYSLGMSLKRKTDSKSTRDKIEDDEVAGLCSMRNKGCEIRMLL